MDVSLIIPCFNEEGNIDSLVNRCQNFLSNKNFELILVNNGSSDNTEKKIDQHLKIDNLKKVNVIDNKGFGYGVLQGLYKAEGKILSYTHADNQTDPNDVLKGLDFINFNKENNFLIKGNRVNLRRNNWKLFEIFITYSMSIFETILFQKILYDIHAQPVIFHKDFLLKWRNPPNDFLIDLYIYYLAKKNKFKIERFPVQFDKKSRIFGEGNNDNFIKTIINSFKRIFSSIILRIKIF